MSFTHAILPLCQNKSHKNMSYRFVFMQIKLIFKAHCRKRESTGASFLLTIRLFALDFYEAIVDSAFGLINYHLIEIESE